jgi:predicted metal-dependent peptidase
MADSILELAKRALHMVRLQVPYLAGLTHHIELSPTHRVDTAGIFASGRLVFNPDWLDQFSLEDMTFIIAHEIMHLALRSHQRVGNLDPELFNITHDFIINDMLKKTLQREEVPAGGLDWKKEYGAYYSIENKSAEELIRFVKDALQKGDMNDRIFRNHWALDPSKGDLLPNTDLADQLKQLLPDKPINLNEVDVISIGSDILSNELERHLFPEAKPAVIAEKQQIIYEKISEVLSLKLGMERAEDLYNVNVQQRYDPQNHSHYESTYASIRALHKPPWEVALQQWVEFTQRTGKTYARPSRRGQHRDLVRPGYKREGNTLHIVIDTSGSMSSTLGKVLGVIASFCDALSIPQVHIIQCDTGVTSDAWYVPEELDNFHIKGLGGSDMSPGMNRLANDPQVTHAIVITDGWISYPQSPMPYEVLWVLTGSFYGFNPGYGHKVLID